MNDKLNIKFNNLKINLFTKIFLIVYFIIGYYFSIKTGISHDEIHEIKNWNINLSAIKGFFQGNIEPYENLLNYKDRFYGIGFNYLSQVYVKILSLIILNKKFSYETSNILLNHSLIFLTFFLSGLVCKKIVHRCIKDKTFSNIFLILYLLYPYLLGHGFYNPKDMPFLFVWILCAHLSIRLFIKLEKDQEILFSEILLISFITSYLLSIRIAGVLIFVHYLALLLLFSSLKKKNLFNLLKENKKKILFFIFFIILFVYLLYPVFWKNPFLIIEAINQMRNFPQGVCTLTLGQCMKALNLPNSYIFIWLFYKLPLLILLGLLVLPFVEKKIFKNNDQIIIFGSILLSVIIIIFLLIFFDVNLYDELRQILFLFPLLMMIGFISFYFFSKKILILLSFLTILIFIIQNIFIYPYQYTWFNSLTYFKNINKNFELDYWGVSGLNIAKKINQSDKLVNLRDNCIYAAPLHVIEPFLDVKFKCKKMLLSIYPKTNEKYILVKFTRNIRRDNPSDCSLIFEETYKLNFFQRDLKVGEVYVCN